MNEQITVCEQRNEKLYVISEQTMFADLDTDTMELFVIYNGTRYTVQGNCYMQYIVIN